MFGALEEVINRNEKGIIMSVTSTKVSAVNFNFSAKFILGNKNDRISNDNTQCLALNLYLNNINYAKHSTNWNKINLFNTEYAMFVVTIILVLKRKQLII